MPPAATRGRASRQARSRVNQLYRAAKRWRVPLWLLVGVKLAETGSGVGIGDESTAGAQGPFQFIPETARTYHVNVNSWQSSANGAAHYLHDLYREHGSWDAALQAYSGGGYGVSHVEGKLGEFGLSKEALGGGGDRFVGFGLGDVLKYLSPLYRLFQGEAPLPKFPGQDKLPFGGGSEGLAETLGLEGVDNFFAMISTTEFWLRLAEVIVGLILIYMGLKALTGVGVSDVPGARTARRAGEAAAFKRLPPKMRVAS